MAGHTVRITEASHEVLRQLAEGAGQPMQAVLAQAIEHYRRKCFLEQSNAAFAALREDPKGWAEEQKERALWDSTLSDGLDR